MTLKIIVKGKAQGEVLVAKKTNKFSWCSGQKNGKNKRQKPRSLW